MRHGIISLSAINFCKCLDLIATCHGLISALIDIDPSSWKTIFQRFFDEEKTRQIKAFKNIRGDKNWAYFLQIA